MISDIEFALSEHNFQFAYKDLQKINLYIKRILLLNTRFNLISNSNSNFNSILNLHVIDSLLGLSTVKEINPSEVLDVGSGAGFPGIILAIFDTSRKYYLLERSKKKSTFLKMIKLELDLENVKILEYEIEKEKKKYEFITIRAFRSMNEYALILKNLLKGGGLIMAYKGKFDRINLEVNQIKNLFSKIEVKPLNSKLRVDRNLVLLYR
ncbi:16S rRNA (guanine(527)-N(7))-methyltransferase RsmG [Borreliella burgdorferi]|uniref:16S rRNA (guanine(527)-N(7))-methyltransferase RsmG n=1 Tax=Borreliella burgdorferi TaxID=139 RepID=UPI00016C5838|nr:16S rRNA (guanine(527)-N(7))-methyltransferase RsmG [Borreliella burgdorferi]AXK70173.1 rRNA small subunit 7-methylguanosine (m7G) methyltransferase GidB [Borreliella burgdorferi]EEH00249.1 methyltransferase GidB [Borreliella burgdorferi 94a]PRR06184.1 16S rRNA (guanine(527)-N(7))-methyltransferase RsmG [Borreliella burgdorferi]PRR42105.1 16S rRNA (guanine(527)-N(7))-methyltransferase RsmG [Borreliella burgdorferi]PRR61031.1 16S rRNA (guanine(527)-N(7))-methyltransferase RsmG [Borreliella b